MFQNIDKDIQYINGIQKMKTYYIVLFSNLEMKVCTEIKLSFISQVSKMMKFIFLNATHTVSIYNRNTLTHIESHCIILLGAILLILLPCVILSLINCSSSFSCRLLHLVLRFQKNSNVDLFRIINEDEHLSFVVSIKNVNHVKANYATIFGKLSDSVV